MVPELKSADAVLLLTQVDRRSLFALLAKYQLGLRLLPVEKKIPGSYWGDSEAGLIGTEIYARDDTPVHSVLHEACHFICMSPQRRAALHTDAGGDFEEENAVCYLQILLADHIPGMGRARMFADMDAWGYTFRLGSAQAWFEGDAQDARDALIRWGILGDGETAQGTLRHA